MKTHAPQKESLFGSQSFGTPCPGWIAVAAMVVMSLCGLRPATGQEVGAVALPQGVRAVWDLDAAYREATATREKVCINGLWLWQPASETAGDVPSGNWGWFKVPGSWPGITNYMQKDCQTVHAHPAWADTSIGQVPAAWYQREIEIPQDWDGRRIVLRAAYVNSLATVYVDGREVGQIRFPAGEADLTGVCRPGGKHRLSIHLLPLPLRGVMLSYNDTASAREVRGSVARRGLCGDVWLVGEPNGPRIGDVKMDTSTREGTITVDAALGGLVAGARYALHARVLDGGDQVAEFSSDTFSAGDLADGRLAFTEDWVPGKLWDTHTPQNQYDLSVALVGAGDATLDTALPRRFGFREFWIDGRDFYLNGTRIFLSSVPLDNAQVGAAWATYEGARESMERLQSFGINFVYTHNYGCEPGSHLSFAEILRAADDVGMLIGLSQPHFGHYDWEAEDAEETNGYAEHAEFYVRVAQNHPSVVAYSTSHNATGYSEDMNPEFIGIGEAPRSSWSAGNVRRALRAEAIIRSLDPGRIVYHHSSGNLSGMYTCNFYGNFIPIQEIGDWFEAWATEGTMPAFLVEFGVPFSWDWTMYRGWYKGRRTFGSAVVPWEFCLAEWNAQFLGDEAYRISEREANNLRWEADQFAAGNLWHRWDYPTQVGSGEFAERDPVFADYFTEEMRSFRTWGVSAFGPWGHGLYWRQREGIDKSRVDLPTDWQNLQRPGFSPDYIDERYERIDLAYDREDWIASGGAQAVIRNNMGLLGYIGGKPGAFTSKDHCFLPGETVDKQLIVINNSRESVTCECRWRLNLPQPVAGSRQVTVDTGQQARVPLAFGLPAGVEAGEYELTASFTFSNGEEQEDAFALHVLAPVPMPEPPARIALFDHEGETAALLAEMGVQFDTVDADADLSAYELVVVGKAALTVDGDTPDFTDVRNGLKVVVFEQTPEVLEARLGFRPAAYGLREVFPRVPDHPLLEGIGLEHLANWRGASTVLPPRLNYETGSPFNGAPYVRWCGIPVSRVWRCGNRGNVASALIEKPACGDFLPIIDGGYALQYSPLMEYREGQGMVIFCQMDVTGRTEEEPVARKLCANILDYAATWEPTPQREIVYIGGADGSAHLERAGFAIASAPSGSRATNGLLVISDGAGEGPVLVPDRVAAFVAAGGRALALGLHAQAARNVLPTATVRDGEHIATYFAPPSADSPLAGIAPADVHNRDPRDLPLVTGGADAVGNGVLGTAADGQIAFCQITPYGVSSAQGELASLRADGQEATAGTQSALVKLGTAPSASFGQAVEAGRAGRTYTFAASFKPLGDPAVIRLEVERAGRPWDRAVRGDDVTVPPDEWIELHETFAVEDEFPEGWQAYVYVMGEGAQVRADGFRLYEGDYVPAATPGRTDLENRITNPSFEDGTESWRFTAREQYNLIRTYRRTSCLLTRLLANMGAACETPILEHLSSPSTGLGGRSLVTNGDLAADADDDGVPDDWTFSSQVPGASCSRTALEQEDGWAVHIVCPDAGDGRRHSAMLAQHNLPITAGQWYRISLRARADGISPGGLTVAIQDTTVWRAVFGYQRCSPAADWKTFTFTAQATDSADRTRFQIWFDEPGRLWLSDIKVQPIDPPGQGRWLEGLYLDEPQEWDDPYRFFRW